MVVFYIKHHGRTLSHANQVSTSCLRSRQLQSHNECAVSLQACARTLANSQGGGSTKLICLWTETQLSVQIGSRTGQRPKLRARTCWRPTDQCVHVHRNIVQMSRSKFSIGCTKRWIMFSGTGRLHVFNYTECINGHCGLVYSLYWFTTIFYYYAWHTSAGAVL